MGFRLRVPGGYLHHNHHALTWYARGAHMKLAEDIDVRINLKIHKIERGKRQALHEGHNIWVDLGREYLAQLIGLSAIGPDTPFRDDRIKYMGFGIGGTRQVAPGVANVEPMLSTYPGPNTQTDIDATVTALERPVRLSGTTTTPPYAAEDVWLGTVQAPAVQGTPTEVTFTRLFSQLELSYGTFLTVPLSEVGLFTSAANPVGVPGNTLVAYDTFDTISKTNAFELEVTWTVRF